MGKRIPLPQEPIASMDAVIQYDRGAKCYILPEYKYFVWKILRKGIRGGKVLDMGTGSGLLAIELAKAKGCHFDITAVDISENMIKRAVDNARQAAVEDKVRFLVSTAAALPFPDNSFDLVMSYASLHHWLEPVTVFNEIERVVKKSGSFIIRDNKRVYQNPFWKAVVWFISRFMNKRHRENWPKAILASYTVPEVKEIIKKSQLRNCRVTSDFVYIIDLCIESR
ncbi:MAG: class I SAM-dependent methyltransferase [Dehalococcoidales bacterium]|nr:class I SAM-dependent methyltransferase [Dehalococcoidales bacterium]